MQPFALRPTGGSLPIPEPTVGVCLVERSPMTFVAGESVVVVPGKYELRGFGSAPVRLGDEESGIGAGVQVWVVHHEGQIIAVPSSAGDPTG